MNAEEDPRFWRRNLGVLLTLLGMVITEITGHLATLPEPTGTVVLLVTLAPVAYAGLSADVRGALVASVLLGAYTLHFLSPHGAVVDPNQTVLTGATIMTGLSLAMSLPLVIVKRREDRLRHDLRAHAAQLERRNRDLVEANAALEAFGYVVSHDLKEPVRAIRAYLESAEESEGEQMRADVKRAFQANERLARQLEGLLAYSRASSTTTISRPIPLRNVLEGDVCRSQYETMLREKKGELDLAPDLPVVLADEVIAAQLFGNLVLNALKHGGDAPRVRVRAEPGRDGLARVLVEDEGTGFGADVLTRFRQLRSRPATVKSGFGLVIAQRAAQRLGGTMALENRPEGGARVVVELPLAK